MAESYSRKVTVEVCNAKNLMPKDGQGTASAFVVVEFDRQRHRTKTIFRDLNPQWDEKLEFSVHDAVSIAKETLKLWVYNNKNAANRIFLGKVKISGSTFFKSGEDVPLVYYPLEKRSVFSHIKGEIGLKVSYVDAHPPPPPPPTEPEKNDAPPPPTEEEKPAEPAEAEAPKDEEKKKEEQKTTTEEPVEAEAPKDEEKKKEEKKTTEEPAEAEAPKDEEKPPLETAPYVQVEHPPVAQQKVTQKTKLPIPPLETAPYVQVEHPPIAQQKVTENAKSMAEIESKLFQRISSGNLVDQMPFLFVRVAKAKLSNPDHAESSSFCAKLVIGTHSIKTKSEPANREWEQIFAFDIESLNSTSLEVSVIAEKKIVEKDTTEEAPVGTVSFHLQEVPRRVPTDSPLAPQWYSLEGEGSQGNDVMLSAWVGTQADEAFQEAWQSDSGGMIPATRAKVYLSPKLWYLRLTVIQTQDLQLGSGPERSPELFVKAQLGEQLFKTSRTGVGFSNPTWNEDLVFVAAEPFEPFLTITVEDVTNGHAVGYAKVQVATVDKRTDDKSEPRSRWFNLYRDNSYTGRIHVRVCLEGGYHVLDEAAHVTSDHRATAQQLSKPSIGLLELGIRGATNLLPVKTADGTRGTIDAYVVAKYGPKWVRTRTILDRFNPRWNEQCTWDVYDPCTVLTIGVFDNGRYNHGDKTGPNKDVQLGKLRLRLSTFDTNRVYVGTYSLTVLLPGGAKKMGEIEIALRFSCYSWISLIQEYANPMLPRMHYVKPMGPAQQEILRHNAIRIVTTRLARSEPALAQEVVQFMLDSDTHKWSMRRCKANWFRVVGCLSRAATFVRWPNEIQMWAHTPTTVMVHILLVAVVSWPHLVLPTIFMYTFLIIAFRFRSCRQRVSITMDPRLSHVEAVGPDELDEEFDGLPTTRSPDQVRIRYDRLRVLAGQAQTLLGDLAAQGERLEALFNWRDPRATGIFLVVCLFASLVLYVVPFKVFVLGSGFYYIRHPKFRNDMPSVPMNFFRRLPPQSDRIL